MMYSPQQTLRTWIQTHYRTLIIIGSWIGVCLITYGTIIWLDLSVHTITSNILLAIQEYWWAPFVFLVIFTIRPIFFIPVSIFTVASGVLFGFPLGVFFAFIGVTCSAITAHALGRWLQFNYRLQTSTPTNRLASINFVHRRPFEVILGLHLAFLPFDLINYSTGLLRLRFMSFLAATIVGMIPGIFSLVSLGASINHEQFLEDGFSLQIFDWSYILLALFIYLTAVYAAHLYRQRCALKNTAS